MDIQTDSLTLEQLQQQNKKLAQQLTEATAKLQWYEEQFRLAQHKRFGASSEKTHPDQMELHLFNEAEVLAVAPGEEPPMEKITYERRKPKGKREDDLSDLPVETVIYTLEEGEQTCACCGHSLHEMTTQTRSEIAIVPPQVKVVRHVQQVYACRHCERNEVHTPIVTAPMPKPV
ncbi:IS66 family transposase zinc-finger binding domain-containing protein, partial [Paenibacillus medicaginis]